MEKLSGRCLCGQVTWTSDGTVLWSDMCHCESCRRANAAPMVPFFGVPRAELRINGRLSTYASSVGVERGFCAECGTPVYYKNEKWPEETHLMSLTLDDPNRVPPREHYHWAERVVWEDGAAFLPKHDASAETTK